MRTNTEYNNRTAENKNKIIEGKIREMITNFKMTMKQT